MNTYTNTKIEELSMAEEIVLTFLQMDEMEYAELMQETGLRFAADACKIFLHQDTVFNRLVNDPKHNFWSWWKLKWKMDDSNLIQSGMLAEGIAYRTLKEAMIGEDLLLKELFYMVNDLV